MRFDWDPWKDESNKKKHGISFDAARHVFEDPYANSIPDETHSVGEEGWITIGQVLTHLIVVVVHAFREKDQEEVIRLISARKATPIERKQYQNLPGGRR